MKVILSVEPIRYPLTGIGRYTLELARNLAALDEIEELRFFAGTDFVADLPSGAEAPPSAPSTRLQMVKRKLARLPFLLDIYRRRIDRARRNNLAGLKDAVYHGPNFYLPLTEGPSVVTVHDLSILKMPECHPPERVAFMSKEIELALSRATMIVTDSEYVRQEIAETFAWPLDRVFTTCLAGSPEFFPRSAAETGPDLGALGLVPNGFTLYAGTIEPRKNLVRLLDAYEQLPPALRRRYPLVLAGYKGWNNTAILEKLRRAESQGWARYLGYVPDEALPHLFAGARLFAFPSLYEGFGLPVLEAMASGVPVVCSDAASLPQVAGNAGLMVQAEDVDALTAALTQGLEDEDWRKIAAEAGIQQAARFSWKRCAEETADVYRLALKAAA